MAARKPKIVQADDIVQLQDGTLVTGEQATAMLALAPEPEGATASPADGPPDTLDELRRQLGALPGDATVHVYRVKDGQRDAWAWEGGPNDFGNSSVQAFIGSKFGPGTYRVRGWQKGVRGFTLNELVTIDGDSLPKVPLGYSGASQSEAMVSTLLSGLQQGFQRLGELIVQTRTPAKTTSEMLQEMALMKQVFSDNTPRPDPLSMMTQVLGIVKELNPVVGESGKVDGMSVLYKAVESFAPAIGDALANRVVQQPAQLPAMPFPPTMPAIPNPAQPLPNVAAGPGSGPGRLGMAITFLLPHAKADSDPSTYAGLALDNVPETELRALLEPADWFPKLTQLDPRVAGFQTWFTELREIIVASLNAPEEPDSEPLTGANPSGISGGMSIPLAASRDPSANG